MNRTGVLDASLVLTVLNEAESLPAFFASLEAMDEVPAEVVVVDGGSTDGTVETLVRLSRASRSRVVILRADGCGIAEGRNLAIEAASHELVLVSDGGTQLSRNWAGDLVRALGKADVASGFFTPRMRPLAFPALLGRIITPTIKEIEPAAFLPSSRSLGLRKSAWRAVGGYPEWLDYCEDLVFDLALRKQRFSFSFAPDAVVTWNARPSLKAFFTQYYRYARGDGKAGLWHKRHAVRYAAYATGTALLVASVLQPLAMLALVAGFGAYAARPVRRVVHSSGELGVRGTASALLLVPVVMVTGDVAKMAGFPVGVRWRSRAPQALGGD